MKLIWIRTSTIFMLIIYLSFFAWGQGNRIDSLENKLKIAKEDTLKVALLYDIARHYSFYAGNPDKENIYLNQLCMLANTLDYPLGQAYCLDVQGISARNASNYSAALTLHKKALKIVLHLHYPQMAATFHNNIGVVYRRFNDYQNALFHHLEALKTAERIHDQRNISIAVNSVGNIYLSMHEYGKALNYFAKGLQLVKENNDSIGIAINLNNIGGVYEKLGDHQKALEYLTQSLTINRELKNTKGIAICFNDIGNIYRSKGETTQALRYFTAALQINEQIGDKKYISANYINLGQIYTTLQDYKPAFKHLKKGLELALQIGAKEEVQKSYTYLSEMYAKAGDYKEALLYHQQAVAYKDSLLNEHNSTNIARLQTIFDTQQKEAHIKLLESEKTRRDHQLLQQRMIATALVLGIIFILVLFIIVYRNNQNRKRLNRLLAYQNSAILHQKDILDLKNQKLTQLNDEKTHLISVVAHDLKSPLSRIFGLANLIKMEAGNLTSNQIQYVELISSMAEKLNEMISKILDMNAIEAQTMNMDLEMADISKLLGETTVNFETAAAKKNIKIIFNHVPGNYQVNLDWGYATQVFDNLISNAVKFSPAHKNIYIHLSEEEDKVHVEIKDQGPGFSQEDMPKIFGKFQRLSARPTAGENSTGLGLSIVKKYMEAMHGEINCISSPGQGATFILIFDKALVNQMAV